YFSSMDTEILRKIGFTEGEIRVYNALIRLEKASTGPIMQESAISSSKVYLILEKLIQKGVVSFVIENNVKKFMVANPKTLVDFVESKQKELEEMKKQTEKFSADILSLIGSHEEEGAQIYKGWAGVKTAFLNVIEELKPGEDFLFFGVSKREMTKRLAAFFKKIDALRDEHRLNTKGIANPEMREVFKQEYWRYQKFTMKYSKVTLPSAFIIGKNRIIVPLWGEYPIAFEIASKRLADNYREFFYSIWNKI
ncbi:MAG: helix-turn-helix domain-containing protein, partial [archaeon]